MADSWERKYISELDMVLDTCPAEVGSFLEAIVLRAAPPHVAAAIRLGATVEYAIVRALARPQEIAPTHLALRVGTDVVRVPFYHSFAGATLDLRRAADALGWCRAAFPSGWPWEWGDAASAE